jgi:hypothetical protein
MVPWWTTNALCRVLRVERSDCEEHVNDMRSKVGISTWRIERALRDELARRTTMAVALPVPRGLLWSTLAWLYDAYGAGVAHAYFSACAAHARDPYFFDRKSWPYDLLRVMSPAKNGTPLSSMAALGAALAAAATMRAGVRSATRLVPGGVWSKTLLRGGAAALWGHVEASAAAETVARGVEAHLRRVATRSRSGSFEARSAIDA